MVIRSIIGTPCSPKYQPRVRREALKDSTDKMAANERVAHLHRTPFCASLSERESATTSIHSPNSLAFVCSMFSMFVLTWNVTSDRR